MEAGRPILHLIRIIRGMLQKINTTAETKRFRDM
jgi:hypothetical protein